MFKICTKDVSFAAIICKGAPPLRIFMHQHFHSYGYKWCSVVVVRTVYLVIFGDLGVDM